MSRILLNRRSFLATTTSVGAMMFLPEWARAQTATPVKGGRLMHCRG